MSTTPISSPELLFLNLAEVERESLAYLDKISNSLETPYSVGRARQDEALIEAKLDGLLAQLSQQSLQMLQLETQASSSPLVNLNSPPPDSAASAKRQRDDLLNHLLVASNFFKTT